MEPVTHLLTGACLARAGLNRKAAYATVAMTLAAEMPDIDTLWGFGGPVVSLEHHRGITHTFLGLPFEAAVLVGAIWAFHRVRTRRNAASETDRSLTITPVRWGLLYVFCLIALLSHIVLDWTNNYGVRPFFPFSPRWYAGSFVFIFEPVIFGLLLLAFVGPFFFGLIGSEVGAKKPKFRGQGWAVFALLGMVVLWGWRWTEREQALVWAAQEDFNGEQKLRAFADPYPYDPYLWHVIVETPGGYHTAIVDTRHDPARAAYPYTIYKPPTTLATLAAKRSFFGQIYLDWSQYPIVEETEVNDQGVATVTFRDLRFLYETFLTRGAVHGRENPPLSGTVKVDAERKVVEMSMGVRKQRP